MSSSAGFGAILFYKGAKGTLELAAAAVLLLWLWAEAGGAVHAAARLLHEHVVRAWSLRLVDLALLEAVPRHARLLCLALGLDSVLNLAEGWCLWRRYSWSEWFVVLSSGAFLPFEVFELAQGIHAGRALVFAVNVSIVAYLAARIVQRRAISRLEERSAPN